MNLPTAMKVANIIDKGGLNTAFSLLDRVTKEELESLCVGVYGQSKKLKENVEKLIEDYYYEMKSIRNLITRDTPERTPEEIEQQKRMKKPVKDLTDYDFLKRYIRSMAKDGHDPKDYNLEQCYDLLREVEKEQLLHSFQKLLNSNLSDTDKKMIMTYLDEWDYDDFYNNERRLKYYIKMSRAK